MNLLTLDVFKDLSQHDLNQRYSNSFALYGEIPKYQYINQFIRDESQQLIIDLDGLWEPFVPHFLYVNKPNSRWYLYEHYPDKSKFYVYLVHLSHRQWCRGLRQGDTFEFLTTTPRQVNVGSLLNQCLEDYNQDNDFKNQFDPEKESQLLTPWIHIDQNRVYVRSSVVGFIKMGDPLELSILPQFADDLLEFFHPSQKVNVRPITQRILRNVKANSYGSF